MAFAPLTKALKIKAFLFRLSGLDSGTEPFPDSLTLLCPPRINETALQIFGSKIRPDSPAFLTHHRMVEVKMKVGEAIDGSRERVRAGDGVRFEVYLREERVLEGVLRREEGDAAMGERVGMSVRKKKNRRERFVLEEIPRREKGRVNRIVGVALAAVVGNRMLVVWEECPTEIVVGARRWIPIRRE